MKVALFGVIVSLVAFTPFTMATLVPPLTNGSTYHGIISDGMHDSECDYDSLFCRTICGSSAPGELWLEKYMLHLEGALPGDVVTLRLVGLDADGQPTTVDADAFPGADATAEVHGASCQAPHFEVLGTHLVAAAVYTVVRSS